MNKKGFTLIEFMIVVCICAIIAAIVFVFVKDSKNREIAKQNVINKVPIESVESERIRNNMRGYVQKRIIDKKANKDYDSLIKQASEMTHAETLMVDRPQQSATVVETKITPVPTPIPDMVPTITTNEPSSQMIRNWKCDRPEGFYSKCTTFFKDESLGIEFHFQYMCNRDEIDINKLRCETL